MTEFQPGDRVRGRSSGGMGTVDAEMFVVYDGDRWPRQGPVRDSGWELVERPKAETAEPRKLRVGDRVVCNGETGEVAAVDKEGLSVQYDCDKAEGESPVWCSYGLWGRERLTLLEAAPEAPGEPAGNPRCLGCGFLRTKPSNPKVGVSVAAYRCNQCHRSQRAWVQLADGSEWLLVPIDRSPYFDWVKQDPITIEDSKAVLSPGPLCEECQGPRRAGCSKCSDCCRCEAPDIDNEGTCIECGDYWDEFDERTALPDYGGNEIGMPSMPPRAVVDEGDVDEACKPSVVLPLDAFIAGRETVRRGAEVVQAQPQVGDAVRAWMWQVFPPKQIEGVMADADDCDPDIIIVRNRQGGRRTQWLSMCHREGAEVVKRKVDL